LIIDIIDETNELKEEFIQLTKNILQLAGEHEKVNDDAEMSVTFVSNEEIKRINHEFRNKDEVTDVLSFPQEELGDGEIEIVGDIPVHLGDVIISLDVVKKQAEEYEHSLEREIAFLAVHGFLHLIGYDHETIEEEKEMFKRQENILQEFGLRR